MQQFSDAFRRCLDEIDIDGVRRLWQHVSPHLPQPATDEQALISIHYARTAAASIELKKRAYSHRWLLDRGYPSLLPDELKPKAERLYPKIVSAVGIAVLAASPYTKPIARQVQSAMEYAVNDAYADGRTDPEFVKKRMSEAAMATRKKLIGV